MPIIFDSKDAVFFVGGRGNKTGDQYAGGGCTKDFWGDLKNPSKALADVMGPNGEVLSNVMAGITPMNVINNGSGKCRLTSPGNGYFTECVAGLISRCMFTAVYASGRYEVTAVDPVEGDWIDIDEPYTSATTSTAQVGGAFNKIQNASDETDANSTTPHNVYILTNKNETFTIAYSIDIDAGGGDRASNTWKRIIGIDNDGAELADGSFVTIDAANYACDCFNIDLVDNIGFRHIYAYNTSGAFSGYNFGDTAESHHGFILDECKATDNNYGIKVQGNQVRNFFVVGGTYSASVIAIYIVKIYGGLIQGVNAYSTGSYVLEFGQYGVPVKDCIIRSNGSSVGAYVASINSPPITNCVFYNITSGIYLSNSSVTLTEYNNIFVVAAKASGKAISRPSGGIAYSDYSCLWALDGAPSDSERWGGDGKPEHAIEEDPDLIDAANGNFRPRKPNVLRGGKPDIAGNTTEMGAVLQEYEFARRAKAANLGRMQIIR